MAYWDGQKFRHKRRGEVYTLRQIGWTLVDKHGLKWSGFGDDPEDAFLDSLHGDSTRSEFEEVE
jgi:hypothetical protein